MELLATILNSMKKSTDTMDNFNATNNMSSNNTVGRSAVRKLIALIIKMANRHEAQIAAFKHVLLKLYRAYETSLNQHREGKLKCEAVAKVEEIRRLSMLNSTSTLTTSQLTLTRMEIQMSRIPVTAFSSS